MTTPGVPGTAVIVDPFSTGADLAPEFRRRSWRTVAVLSSPHLPALYANAVRREDYDSVVVHHGDVAVTAGKVAGFDPTAVLAGTEIGVPLTDSLAHALGLPGNDLSLSRARRHKAEMATALAAAGLLVPLATEVESADAAVAWFARHGFPVVVKPVDSAGADGVTFCATAAQVADAVDAILGKVNRMSLVNRTVLVQEAMQGRQYFVNTVSLGGRHRVVEIWSDNRRRLPSGVVCDREDLLDSTGPLQDELVSYVLGTLDALGVQEGAGHTELMRTDRGVMLIESAARMQGTIVPGAVLEALGENHVTATAGAVLDPDAFARATSQPYRRRKHASVVSLIAPHDGAINSLGATAMLDGISSVHSVLGDVAPGTPVQETVDLFTSPGFVYLVSEDAQQIDKDYRRIRELEAGGLYV
jgi:biotin carboxylase